MLEYHIGQEVTIRHDGKSIVGTITCIYAVPKDYDLVDIQTADELLLGISTEEIVAE